MNKNLESTVESCIFFIFFFWDPFVAAWNHCGFSLHQVPVGSIFSFFVLFCFLNSVCFFVFTALEKKEVIFHPRSRPQGKDQKTWGSQNTVKSFWDVKCLDERGLDLIISLRTHILWFYSVKNLRKLEGCKSFFRQYIYFIISQESILLPRPETRAFGAGDVLSTVNWTLLRHYPMCVCSEIIGLWNINYKSEVPRNRLILLMSKHWTPIREMLWVKNPTTLTPTL